MTRREIVVHIVAVCLVIAAVVLWLVAPRYFWLANIAVVAGCAIFWRAVGERRRTVWRDWYPRRRAYLVPLVTAAIGLSVAAVVPGHTSPVIGLGIWVFAVSGVLVMVITAKRMLNSTDG